MLFSELLNPVWSDLSRSSKASSSFCLTVRRSKQPRTKSVSSSFPCSSLLSSRVKDSFVWVAWSSRATVSFVSTSIRFTISSTCVVCCAPSLSLATWTSMFQTISLRRFASTTACSTVCFCCSSTLTFCSTCSASELSVAIRVSVLLLNSCISATGPSFFSTSLTASVVAVACSRVSRSESLSRAWSFVNFPVRPRRRSKSAFIDVALLAESSTSVCATRSRSRNSSSVLCSFFIASSSATFWVACADNCCTSWRCFWSSPFGASSCWAVSSTLRTPPRSVSIRLPISSRPVARASSFDNRFARAAIFPVAPPARSFTSCIDRPSVESFDPCTSTWVSIVLSAARSSRACPISSCSSATCSLADFPPSPTPRLLNASSMSDSH